MAEKEATNAPAIRLVNFISEEQVSLLLSNPNPKSEGIFFDLKNLNCA
jgi:hypothetical protein